MVGAKCHGGQCVQESDGDQDAQVREQEKQAARAEVYGARPGEQGDGKDRDQQRQHHGECGSA